MKNEQGFLYYTKSSHHLAVRVSSQRGSRERSIIEDTMAEQTTAQLIKAATDLFTAGDRASARVMLEQACRQDPSDVRVWAGLSMTTDNLAEEQRCLEEVLRLDPNNHWALVGVAR